MRYELGCFFLSVLSLSSLLVLGLRIERKYMGTGGSGGGLLSRSYKGTEKSKQQSVLFSVHDVGV